MTDKQIIDLIEIDQKYKDKCSLIKAGKCKNVNIFIEQSRKLKRKEQECEFGNLRRIQLQETLSQYKTELDQLKAENEQLKEELSTIQHNCNREGCKYYDDDTFKVFYECKAQKALQLSANSVTTKYCDLLQTLAEIKEIAEETSQAKFRNNACIGCAFLNDKILQKISEVEDER